MCYYCHNVFKTTSKCKCNVKEYRYKFCVPAFSIQSRQYCSVVCPPICRNSVKKCSHLSKIFRLFYERGDLPCAVQHTSQGQTLKWFVSDLERLNIDYYFPIFTDGLREIKYPYWFIALQGTLDLIEYASHKIDAEILPKVIPSLKCALYTNNLTVISRTLIVLQKLARGNDGAIGIALVPYFNILLPVINIIRERNQNKSYRNRKDCIMIDDFKKDVESELVRRIDETLFTLEQYGGPDGFINIKYSVPTYEQQADLKQLSTTQTDTLLQPILDIE